MTSINDIADLARILREQPEWADTIRSILLGQELLELPERFARFVDLTTENFRLVHQRLDRLETSVAEVETSVAGLETSVAEVKTDVAGVKTDVAEIKTDVAEIKTRLNRMDGRMDNGFGTNYELKVEKHIRSIAGQYLNLRRIRVLRGLYAPTDPDLEARLDQAEEDSSIPMDEIDNLWRADLILTGRDRATGADVYIVIEASITIGDSDITRAKARAETLSSITGQPAIPAVVGANVDEARTTSAALQGVAIAIEPEN